MTDPHDVFQRGRWVAPLDSTSPSLVSGLQNGEEDSWSRMVQSYAPHIFRWCRRFGVPVEDAGDVTQEILMAASRSIGAFGHRDGKTTFRGWLWTMARNRSIDYLRRHQRSLAMAAGGSTAQEILSQIPDNYDAFWERDPEERSAFSESVMAALQSIRLQFEASSWTAFWRTAVEGEPAAEVAASLGMTVNAVYLARSRILRGLRKALGDVPDGGL